MKTILKAAALATFAVAIAPAAHAATYEGQLTELRTKFKASDVNKDGRLTKKEAKDGGMSRLARFWSRADTDNDGYVTLAQLEKHLADRYK